MAAQRLDFTNGAVIDGTKVDLSLHTGDDYAVTLFLKDSNGDPIDITGWTFAMDVEDSNGTPVVDLDVSIADATGGEILIEKARAVTETLSDRSAKDHKYDLFAIDATNKRRKWTYGAFEVSRSITDE